MKIKFDFIKTENKNLRENQVQIIKLLYKKSKIRKKYCVYVGDMPVDNVTAKELILTFYWLIMDMVQILKVQKNDKIFKFIKYL